MNNSSMQTYSPKFTLKVYYGNDIHRLSFSGADFSFENLISFIQSVYGLKSFSMKYVDDEGDKITLACDKDVSEALYCCKAAILKIYVYKI